MELADLETDERAAKQIDRDTTELYFDAERQSRFAIAALTVLASPFLVDGLVTALLHGIRGDSIFITVLFGLIVAKFGLVAMWLGWGGSRTIWRMLIVMLSLLFTSLVIPGIDRDRPQVFLVMLLATLLT